MILVNQKILDTRNTDKNYDLIAYAEDYRSCLADLRKEYPDNKIRLQRVGWPKKSKSTGISREVPPITLPLSMTQNGEVWAYSKTSAKIEPNGLADIKETSMMVTGLSWTIDIAKDPDLAVYMMYKTPFINLYFVVKDAAKEARKLADAKRAELNLGKQIYEGLSDDNKARMVAASWGVDGAMTDTPDQVRINLEEKVRAEQAKKDKNPETRSLRGIAEFIEDVKGDPAIRRRAALQYALDNKKMVLDRFTGWYMIGDRKVVYIPSEHLDTPLMYAGNYFGDSMKKEDWLMFLKDIVNEDFINIQDKQGIFWLAKELGIDVGVKITAEEAKAKLLEEYLK